MFLFLLGDQKIRVIWKIDTSNTLDNKKKDEMMELIRKAASTITIWEPYFIECVDSGCIRLCTLLPISWLINESDFKQSVHNFLDQIVSTCNISTRNPLEMNVKIVVQKYTDHGKHTIYTYCKLCIERKRQYMNQSFTW